MSVETDIRSRLVADATVGGLVVARIYPEILPQNPTMDAITYSTISAVGNQQLAAAGTWTFGRLQLRSWSDTKLGALGFGWVHVN